VAQIQAIRQDQPRQRDGLQVEVLPAIKVRIAPKAAAQADESLRVGGQLHLEAHLEHSDLGVSWGSSNTGIASVSSDGLVDGLAEGSVTIVATSLEDPEARGELSLEVKASGPPPVITIDLEPSAPQTLSVGDTLRLSASIGGTEDKRVRWESDKPSVAEVEQGGFLRAQSAGVASISVVSLADTSKRAAVLVTVVASTLSLALSPSTPQTLSPSQTLQVSANTAVHWNSNRPEVLNISDSGLITAKTIGEALVTATAQADASRSATLTVQVVSVQVNITTPPQTLKVGQTLQLSAEVLDSQGRKVPDQRIRWQSSDWKTLSVEENTGVVKANQAGEAILYALSQAQPEQGASIKLVAQAATPPPTASPIRILPLGDSITQGINWTTPLYNTYRRPLWHLLKNAGYKVDFIGSMNKVMSHNCTVGVPNPDFDQDHEGHSGWRADQILNGVGHSDCAGSGGLSLWLGGYTPDVVLLHLGTNDLIQGQSIESTLSELEGIIKLLRSKNPNVSVLLAKIIPASDSRVSQRIPQLNAQIPALVNRMNTASSRVVLVDMTEGFNALTDLSDGIHPNNSGDQKMAQHWYKALVQVLPK
jgi:uncharacterized protein YjdB